MYSNNNNNNINFYFLYSTFVDVSLSGTLLSSAGPPHSIENLCPSKEEEREGREGERRRKGEKEREGGKERGTAYSNYY